MFQSAGICSFIVPTSIGDPSEGKVRQFYPKFWKFDGILPKILEKWGHFSQLLYFSLIFLIEVYFLNFLNSKSLKNTGKWKQILQKSGNLCVHMYMHAIFPAASVDHDQDK